MPRLSFRYSWAFHAVEAWNSLLMFSDAMFKLAILLVLPCSRDITVISVRHSYLINTLQNYVSTVFCDSIFQCFLQLFFTHTCLVWMSPCTPWNKEVYSTYITPWYLYILQTESQLFITSSVQCSPPDRFPHSIVWEAIQKRADNQLVREHSAIVISACWATVDWSWHKE